MRHHQVALSSCVGKSPSRTRKGEESTTPALAEVVGEASRSPNYDVDRRERKACHDWQLVVTSSPGMGKAVTGRKGKKGRTPYL